MRINQLVNQALTCVEEAKAAKDKGKDPAPLLERANEILKQEIGNHPDRRAFFANKTSPFFEVYIELLRNVDQAMYPINDDYTPPAAGAGAGAAAGADRGPSEPPKAPLAERFANVRRVPVPAAPTPEPEPLEAAAGPEPAPSSPAAASPAKVLRRPPIPRTQPLLKMPEPAPPKENVTPPQLHKLLVQHAQKVLVLDIRDRASFNEYHIDVPHTGCLEYFRLKPGVTQQDLEDLMLVAPRDDQLAFAKRASYKLIVLVDDGSHHEAIAALKHALSGFRVMVLAGGIDAWVSYSLPTINSEPSPEPPSPFQQLQAPQQDGTIRIANGVVQPLAQPLAPLVNYPSVERVPNYTRPPVPLPSAATSAAPNAHAHTPHDPAAHPYTAPRDAHAALLNYEPAPFTPAPILCGLKNLGNTCYQNCVLQCLFGTLDVMKPFLDGSYRRLINKNSRLGYSGKLAHEFAKLVAMAGHAPPNTFIAAFDLKQLAGQLQDTFLGYDQQDCQEFLTFLLDGLHEELNSRGDYPHEPPLTEVQEQVRESYDMRVAAAIEWERYMRTNASLIVDEVQGQYASRLECTVCHTTSTTYTAFSTLTLPLVKSRKGTVDLLECFKAFVAPQMLQGDNAWFCPRCNRKQKTIQYLKLSRLPKFLIIHLKRFKQKRTLSGISADKLEQSVRYPVYHLDLTGYCPENTPLAPRDAEIWAKLPSRSQNPPFVYDLYAVATHHGTLKSGHYTAFVRKEPHGWYYFDDTNVVPLRDNNVVTRNAYVLFYQRRQNV